jgi:hypothetical protein
MILKAAKKGGSQETKTTSVSLRPGSLQCTSSVSSHHPLSHLHVVGFAQEHTHEREVEQEHGRFSGDERRGDKLACILALFFIHWT